ncbi:diacylglycerol kinase family protein [Pilimelia columellifera]|uniref:DAGKc domain-containing protein n=1 Tax=Pilimelia columellifera subsp. columellifera TaxID=706583 RepID=A0ABN3N1V4_9ACTN
MDDVVILTLGDDVGGGCAGGCCGDDAGCGTPKQRVPVLACADALTAAGARVETITASSDADIDAVIARLDGPARPDGLTWPGVTGPRLIVAAAADGQVRAVVRRMVRRYAPPPSRRPADLSPTRTVPDLPPIGVLPLDPAGADAPNDLATQLGLPRDPAAVAAAALAGRMRRVDLLRTDGGSVTLDGALIGSADGAGRSLPWHGRVEVDDAVLTDGADPVLAAAIVNGAGYATVSGVPVISAPDAADGLVDVAVAVPARARGLFGRRRPRVEIRRARGRAVSVTPSADGLPFVDDGVSGTLRRKRAWWMEAGAWAVYAS